MGNKTYTELGNKRLYGVCPTCWNDHRVVTNSLLNIGQDDWFYCDLHKVRWSPGVDVLGDWRIQHEAVWEHNRKHIEAYTVVEPARLDDMTVDELEDCHDRLIDRPNKKPFPVVVRINDSVPDKACACCGMVTYVETGPWYFEADTWNPVCPECARMHSPFLYAARFILEEHPDIMDRIMEAVRGLEGDD